MTRAADSAIAGPASSPTRYDHGPADMANAVKTGLTPKPRRPAVENNAYNAFTRRVLRAYARRVASGDIDALTQMTSLATDMDKAIGQAVLGLRSFGYSWADIAARLGITRQAAQQRWGTPQPPQAA